MGAIFSSEVKDLTSKNITEIPKEVLEKCAEIRDLYLSYNPRIRLNNAIGRFNNLRSLELFNCALRDVPDEIGTLTELVLLDLSLNTFTNGINPSVGRLRHLKYLHLIHCELQNLPDSFRDLEELTVLNLQSNCLTQYPSCILNLKNLEKLDLSFPGTNIRQLYEFTRSRWGLHYEIFSEGQEWNIEEQQRLYFGTHREVMQRYDGTTELQKSIHQLRVLEALNRDRPSSTIADNIWERLDYKEHAEQPQSLQLQRQHGISSLPMELAETSLSSLRLAGNPITDPPKEICIQGLDAIKSYLREKRLGSDDLCPDTINIIGDSFAGKTSIAQSLVKGSPQLAANDDRTRVMQQIRAAFGENGKLLVNINDFGGHTIYHCVIPIFLPTDGLTIVVYNMFTTSIDDQKNAVRRWLLTAIAKLKNIRLIVAGTRSDLISQDQRKAMENTMVQFVSALLNDVKSEIRRHIGRLEQRSSNSEEKKLTHLRDLLLRLSNADISVVSLSCRERNPGLNELRYNVWNKLRKAHSMPSRWFRFMKSMLHTSSNRPYLTWSEVQKLYREEVPDGDGDKDLVVILRYLVSTSQVVWLESHQMLKEFIFHSPQSILKVCKDVLSHDHSLQGASQLVNVTDQDRKRYLKGIVQHPFMMELISDREIAPVSIEFLKNFNLISEITASDGIKTYVMPSNLPAEEPPQMRVLEQPLHSCPNSVVINLIFLGSVLPMSFLETSLSLMLTIATRLFKDYMKTEVWRHGLIITYDRVYFIAKHRDNILTLAATSSDSTSNPWAILLPILKGIHESITASWHGATPDSELLCPVCRISLRPESDVGFNPITLETLVTKVQHRGATWTCTKCAETIPPCLFLPFIRESLTANELDELKTFFTKYGMDVSGGVYRSSATTNTPLVVHSTGTLDLPSKYDVRWTTVTDAHAREALRKSYDELTSLLKCDEVRDKLYSLGVLTPTEHETNKSIQNPSTARRDLVDTIRTRGQPGLKAFAEALHATRQFVVYKTVMKYLREQVPQAFVAETARST